LNVVALIDRAAASTELRAIAAEHLCDAIKAGALAYQGRKPEIRPSDYGSCRLSLWAEIHGLADIPRNPIDSQLARLDVGSLMGAWEACLLKAAIEAEYSITANDFWECELEYVPDGGGHIDARLQHFVYGDEDNPQVSVERIPVEFKSKYDATPVSAGFVFKENRNHALQVSDYGIKDGAKRAILVYFLPANKSGKRLWQFTFDLYPWWPEAVRIERERLAPALDDEPPKADPQTLFACYVCRFAGCPDNKNKASVPAVFTEDDFA
jgi:hypothetical protein